MGISVPVYESEDYLVQQAIKRDRAAFSSLYDCCIDRVYRHVFYRVSNQKDAEDITQEVFARAWQAIDKYQQTGAPFVAWLLIIAGHLIIDHYRNREKTVKIDEAYQKNSVTQVIDPVEKAEISLNNALVKEAVLKLKGDKQRVILMHFIDGFSYEEIAKALNKSENAVRVIQYRALEDLKKLLKRD
jgi:RNA polymerase sigma-70 factor (ECF subfamily)